ncbi:MAG: GNAT family N-acetyltransferase [Flaviflexus sp.]|uniref:GNAT family N-acetyltransferase n=1 Tax=Flaviflexus sp. TaxID=1969482 RepID=UPI003F906EF4
MDSLFPTKPTITGSLVQLRPFTEVDIERMGPILADPELIKLTGSANTTEEIKKAVPALDERTLEWYRTREEQTDRLDLAIIDLSNDQCVGEAVLNAWSPADRSCNYRILIGPEGRGRGFGSEATSLVIDYAFENTNLNRISLDVLAFNPRARRAYEKAGFLYEGTSREAFRFDGEYIDDVLMAILRSDWKRKSSGD